GWDPPSRIADPRLVSRRPHQHGAAITVCPGIFSRRLLAGRSRTALPGEQCRLALTPRESRHPAQRHTPDTGGPGVDADFARRSTSRLGPGLELDAEDTGVHEPYIAARSFGKMAG